MKNFTLSCCLIFWVGSCLWGQRTISGTIFDDLGYPLDEVTAYVLGTNIGSVSDDEGKYTLKVSGDSAVIKFIYHSGWSSPEVRLGTEEVLNVVVVPYMPLDRSKSIPNTNTLDKPVTVRGRIVDERKEPLIGAAIWVHGSNPQVGTLTDIDGYYQLEMPPGPNLVKINYDGGWSTVEVTVAESCYLEVFNLPWEIVDRYERRLKGKKKKRGKN